MGSLSGLPDVSRVLVAGLSASLDFVDFDRNVSSRSGTEIYPN